MKFVKKDDFWWIYDEKTPKKCADLYDVYGFWSPNNDITKLEIVEAKNFQSLDWEGTPILNSNCKLGWLDRNGKFYGCEYEYHEKQAFILHGKTPEELEKLGWIHLSAPYTANSYIVNALFFGDYENGVMPTDAQLDYLSKRNDINYNMIIQALENGNEEKARIYEENLKKEAKKQKSAEDEELTM